MILLWGLAADTPLREVRSALDSMGASVLFADQARALATDGELSVGPGPGPDGWLEVAGARHALSSFGSMYVRPYDFRQFPLMADKPQDDPQWQHALRVEHLIWGLAEMADALVVNRPSAMQSNGSKPFQARMIRAHGFAVPETLLTTDLAALRRFRARHDRVVYKSASGERSIVTLLGPADEERLEDLRWCPTQFQEHIDGEEIRVHVVGRRAFAARIVSSDIDYRYGTALVEPYNLSTEVATRCLNLARALGLMVAGLDLRRAPDGRWYCFEVNPSPAFTCYEVNPRSIAGAVAALLMHADQAKGTRGPARPTTGLPSV